MLKKGQSEIRLIYVIGQKKLKHGMSDWFELKLCDVYPAPFYMGVFSPTSCSSAFPPPPSNPSMPSLLGSCGTLFSAQMQINKLTAHHI